MKTIRLCLYKSNKFDYILGVFILPFFDRLFAPIVIFFYSYIISIAINNNLSKTLMIVLIFSSIFLFIHYFKTYYSTILQVKYTNIIKNEFIKNYILSSENDVNRYSSGQLTEMYKNSSEIAKIPMLCAENFFIQVEMIIIVISIWYYLGIFIALINILLISFYYFFQLTGKVLARERKKVLIISSHMNEFFDDSIEGIEVIRSYRKEAVFIKKMDSYCQKFNKIKTKYGVIEMSIQIISRYLTIIIVSTSVVTSILLIPPNKKILFVSVSFLSGFLAQCLAELFENTKGKKNVSEIIKQYPIFLAQNAFKDKKPKPLFNPPFFLTMKDLSYAYDGHSVFKNVNFSFPSRGIVVIEGESGSGKSTLLKCISGLYNDYGGEIHLNGSPLSNSLFNVVPLSYSPQTPLILEMSIKDNIVMGNESTIFNDTNIFVKEAIAYLPNINSIASKETLSGGQRQIIDILRGLNNKSDVFILDEPTSSQHKISGEIIANLLKDYAKSGLVIISTHDQELINTADVVFNIKNCHIN